MENWPNSCRCLIQNSHCPPVVLTTLHAVKIQACNPTLALLLTPTRTLRNRRATLLNRTTARLLWMRPLQVARTNRSTHIKRPLFLLCIVEFVTPDNAKFFWVQFEQDLEYTPALLTGFLVIFPFKRFRRDEKLSSLTGTLFVAKLIVRTPSSKCKVHTLWNNSRTRNQSTSRMWRAKWVCRTLQWFDCLLSCSLLFFHRTDSSSFFWSERKRTASLIDFHASFVLFVLMLLS